jgi:hypothetical protein
VPRILAGSSVGTLAGAGGGIVGFLGGFILAGCGVFEGCDNDSELRIAVPTVLGVGLASSFTVYGLGQAMDGDGQVLPTLLGGLLGASTGVVGAYASNDGAAGWVLLTPVLSAVGAVIAYEVSSMSREPEPTEASDPYSNLRLTPVFGMTPKGGVLGGLMGQF